MFTALLAASFVFQAVSLPVAGTTPANAVPYQTIERVATTYANREFPGATPGTVVPYCDETGATVAYMFHFRTDGKPFPAYDQVAADVQAERKQLSVNTNLMQWRSKYAHVLVSARWDRAPVINFGYGTSEYFAIAQAGLDRARARIGDDARLSRIYFLEGPTYLEYTNGTGGQVVMSNHFERAWDSRAAFQSEKQARRAAFFAANPVDEDAAAKAHAAEWNLVLGGLKGSFSEAYVPTPELAPFYDWSYGCTPTSGAMVMGYIDRTLDYGRLVDWYFQRADPIENEEDYQVPNVQLECAIAMGTDTTTGGTMFPYIAYGLESVGDENGYMLTSTNVQGTASSDWAWTTLTNEINAGHPMVWSISWETHSLCGLGYRTDDKFVYVHNTWWEPAEWWAHSGSGISHVAAITSDGGDVHKLRLTYPLGDTFYNSNGRGETFYVGDTVVVTWDNNGHPASSVDMDFSTDGGHSWQSAATGLADNGSYHWYVPPAIPTCDSVRLRLLQYNGSDYTSGDATFGNFRVYREPLPPALVAPANGMPVMHPPVVLIVDPGSPSVDSIDFKLIHALDTLWHQCGTSPQCSLPNNLFVYNQTYKWRDRGHNQFGWGPWSGTWSFRTLWSGIEEQPAAQLPAAGLSVPAVQALGRGELEFTVGAAGPGARLLVFDAAGKLSRSLAVSGAGRYSWDMRDGAGQKVAAGLYFCRLESAGSSQVRKLILVD